MKKVGFLVTLVLLLSVPAFGQSYLATLSGANEVPPADPDGTGTAIITISGTTVNYTITVANIAAPIAQHIHSGAAGVNGPIVVNLPGTWVGNTLNGSTTTDGATAASIIANPAAFYVNVHNNDFPGGAVRGQLALTNVDTMPRFMLFLIAAVIAVVAVFVIRR